MTTRQLLPRPIQDRGDQRGVEFVPHCEVMTRMRLLRECRRPWEQDCKKEYSRDSPEHRLPPHPGRVRGVQRAFRRTVFRGVSRLNCLLRARAWVTPWRYAAELPALPRASPRDVR